MSRYPEVLQLRVQPGMNSALEAIARREGKRAPDVVREALAALLQQRAPEGRAA